jgi:SAM-dependent methyltransferase
VIDTIATVLFWIYLPLYLWWCYIVFFNRGIPPITVAPPIRARMAQIIAQDMAEKGAGPYVIVDLGSGPGILTRGLARALPQARVIGVEIDPAGVYWARFWAYVLGIKNLDYRRMRIEAFDLAQADAVVMFLMPGFMPLITTQLRAQAKDGVLILSNRFVLSEWPPERQEQIETKYPLQGLLNIYRK